MNDDKKIAFPTGSRLRTLGEGDLLLLIYLLSVEPLLLEVFYRYGLGEVISLI